MKPQMMQFKGMSPSPRKAKKNAVNTPQVYRPNQTPKCLQMKSRQTEPIKQATVARRPTAPPVYKPQQVPRCLQAKKASQTLPGTIPSNQQRTGVIANQPALHSKNGQAKIADTSYIAQQVRPVSTVAQGSKNRTVSALPNPTTRLIHAPLASTKLNIGTQKSPRSFAAHLNSHNIQRKQLFNAKHGVTNQRKTAVQMLKLYNHINRQFINDEDNETAPEGYSTVSKYFHEYHQAPWTSTRQDVIIHASTEDYDSRREGIKNVNMDYWNTPIAVKGGIYTEAMSSCTTIGFRASCNGELYTAIYHNTGTDQTFQQIWQKIMLPLMEEFNGENGLPKLKKLTNIKWFAIGGSPTSKVTCENIKKAFGMFVIGPKEIKLFTDKSDKLTKNAMVTRYGEIIYSLEE